jgi:hypothetical protein
MVNMEKVCESTVSVEKVRGWIGNNVGRKTFLSLRAFQPGVR